MQRRVRSNTTVKPGQKCYFTEWDYCSSCHYVQHYEKYKKFVVEETLFNQC